MKKYFLVLRNKNNEYSIKEVPEKDLMDGKAFGEYSVLGKCPTRESAEARLRQFHRN